MKIFNLIVVVFLSLAVSTVYANDAVDEDFVNFVHRLPHVPSDSLQNVVDNFLDKANVDQEKYTSIYKLAGKYLYSLDSPMRDERLYILFLNHAINEGKLGDAERERAVFRLEMAMKNLPGDVAPDFMVMTRDGKEKRFHELLRGESNIVVFYDPDCRHCEEVLTELAENKQSNDFNVVAIDSEEDKLLWQQTAPYLPESWEVGFSLDPIQDDELYVFPEMPTIYLIGGDGTILIKEASLLNIINKLQ